MGASKRQFQDDRAIDYGYDGIDDSYWYNSNGMIFSDADNGL